MKYLAMSPRPTKKVKIHACRFNMHSNKIHLTGLILILIGVILLQVVSRF